MNMTITPLWQAAQAVGLDPEEFNKKLECCGVQPADGQLDERQVKTLLYFLDEKNSESRRRSEEKLTYLVKRFALIIDTCSLLHPQFPALMSHLTPLLRKNGKTLMIPSSVVSELKCLSRKKEELQERIRTVFKQLLFLSREGLVDVFEEPGGIFADKQLLATATRFLTDTELLVITQDAALASDLLHLNQLNSVRGKRLAVEKVNRFGYLSNALPGEMGFESHYAAPLWPGFSRGMIPVSAAGSPAQHDGEMAFSERKPASGGKRAIYALNGPAAVKRHHPEKSGFGRQSGFLN